MNTSWEEKDGQPILCRAIGTRKGRRGVCAYVIHPEAHQAEVVSIFRVTPREE